MGSEGMQLGLAGATDPEASHCIRCIGPRSVEQREHCDGRGPGENDLHHS